jgi:tripartite-type tricarboxylate transporter receptor subunit TctC
MQFTRRHALKVLAYGAWVAEAPAVLAQEAFPSKPLTLVVPQPVGGGADALCRLLQPRLQELLGQPVVIENKGGAAGNIGTAAGLKAAPDGYTVTFVNLSTMALNPHLYAKPGYTVADMQPVIWLASVSNIIVVNPDKVPARTMKEFIDLVRKSPGKLTYATAGNGSGNHLGGELLKGLAGMFMLHIPYRGGGPALTALLAGDVDAAVADPLAVLPHIKSGKLRALAVTSAKRSSALPDVPTVAESGIPGYEASSWAGIVVPRGTPAAVVEKLRSAFDQALRTPANASRLASQLYEPVGAGPAEFAKFAAAENTKWAAVIKRLDIKLD